MARSNNENHKAAKQTDNQKEKLAEKKPQRQTLNSKEMNVPKPKTRYHSPHAF